MRHVSTPLPDTTKKFVRRRVDILHDHALRLAVNFNWLHRQAFTEVLQSVGAAVGKKRSY